MDRRWHFLLFLFALTVPLGFTAFFITLPDPFLSRLPASRAGSARSAPEPIQVSPFRAAATRGGAPPFGAADERRLAELARSGEACALLESPLSAQAPLLALYRLLPSGDSAPVPADALEAYLRALSARSPAAFSAALHSAQRHPLLDLTEASGELGLLPGLPFTHRDPRAAIPLLRALAYAEPLNAAPSLLLAYALKLVGEPGESAAELERALARPQLRTYAEDAQQTLYVRANGRPAPLSAALAIGARAPGPDLWPIEDLVLDSLVDGDPRLADLAYAFGRRLATRDGVPTARAAFSSALNFGFGQRIEATAWKRLHPAQNAPRALAERPLPAARREALPLLTGFHLPLTRGACEQELPRFAARLRAERERADRVPAVE